MLWFSAEEMEVQTHSWCVCALACTGRAHRSLALTGSEGVTVLTFYLLEFALAVSVKGSEEQLVPGPGTPTSPIPNTPPHSQRLQLCPCLFFCFFH